MVATASDQTHATGTEAFFGRNSLYVEERRRGIKSRNEFAVWDEHGQRIGQLVQKVSAFSFLCRVFLSPSLLPFRFEIQDRQGRTVAGIRRSWTVFVSRTEVFDDKGQVIGFLKHKERSRKPRIKIFNEAGKKIGEITGTQAHWDMALIDRDYHSFGTIREFDAKTTPGDTAGKDTYFISLQREALTGSERQVMLIIAVAVDRLLLTNG
ncbi:MAG: hypothetical protein EOO15_12945 [Chitinophagaceae bacterium]|nr:MAG: hypothetical protein EOO15_12945 [Chitinophagaceae bacterium]